MEATKYVSAATEAVDTKFGDLEFPWSPHHETATSEIYEDPSMCASCHNELNPYNIWVKATFTESDLAILNYNMLFIRKQYQIQIKEWIRQDKWDLNLGEVIKGFYMEPMY